MELPALTEIKSNMEKLPKNTSEAVRFSGGLSKILRDMEEQMSVLQQGIARAGDLIFFYETELTKRATAKVFDNIGNWAKNTAKQALKTGGKM